MVKDYPNDGEKDDLGLNLSDISTLEAHNTLEDKTKIVVDWCCANKLSEFWEGAGPST
ncbi:hypothetical protein J6590_096002 [Homalodisca vitripennis]|nr:hypothetical protein J6590_096002 [Homalodisca vitripennis]